jgi:hypothetical protein
MTVDEGYIKYGSDWTPGPATHPGAVQELEAWRRPLYDAGLIGEYADQGIGYGNISLRCGSSDRFLISGTRTGGLAVTDERHYALVVGCDLRANTLPCRGPIRASSEAMTHAALYAVDEAIGAIVHAHSRELWEASLGKLPTTNPAAAYGTPEMAMELGRLYRRGGFREAGIAVLAGHEPGLISFGTTLEEAATRMLDLGLPKKRGSDPD